MTLSIIAGGFPRNHQNGRTYGTLTCTKGKSSPSFTRGANSPLSYSAPYMYASLDVYFVVRSGGRQTNSAAAPGWSYQDPPAKYYINKSRHILLLLRILSSATVYAGNSATYRRPKAYIAAGIDSLFCIYYR